MCGRIPISHVYYLWQRSKRDSRIKEENKMFESQPNYYGAAPMGAPMGGYQFNGMAPQATMKVQNVLSEAEIKELQSTASQFSLGLTDREMLQAACNHRSADGTTDTLVIDPKTGLCRCTICGYEFKPVDSDTSYEVIKDACDRIVDLLQTIKIMYTDLPAQAAREYFPIIPLINKIPQLFQFAAKSFAKHEYTGWTWNNQSMAGAAMFQNLNNIFGAGMQPMQNPAFAGGFMNAPQAPANGFGYPGASQPQPFNQGYQYVPGQAPVAAAPTVAAPVAPEATPTETVKQTVNV